MKKIQIEKQLKNNMLKNVQCPKEKCASKVIIKKII